MTHPNLNSMLLLSLWLSCSVPFAFAPPPHDVLALLLHWYLHSFGVLATTMFVLIHVSQKLLAVQLILVNNHWAHLMVSLTCDGIIDTLICLVWRGCLVKILHLSTRQQINHSNHIKINCLDTSKVLSCSSEKSRCFPTRYKSTY